MTFLFQQVKAIADTGCKVIVSGGKVGDLTLHYCNKYQIMVVRLLSKFDLRRLCRAIQATPLPRIVSAAAHRQGPGTVFTKGLKSRVLSLDLSNDLGQDSRRIH